jgi:hypothetical protein
MQMPAGPGLGLNNWKEAQVLGLDSWKWAQALGQTA